MMAAMLGALTACEKISVEDAESNGGGNFDPSKKFTFTVKGDFQNPEFTRANQYMTADGVELTDMWVVDYKDGAIKQEMHQGKDDADWGSPSMSLTLGTHHILFLASRGTNPTYNNGVVTWSRMNDTFYLDYEVTVVKTSNGNRAVTLNRCATKFALVIEDAIAQGTTSVTISPETWFTGWNMLSGVPVASSEYVAQYDLPQSWIGSKGATLNMWGLSAGEEWQTNISIVSKAGEVTNAEALIEAAPLKANRTTKYSGSLYSNATNSSVSLNATWLTQYEGVY